jgi:glycosyltransferase involved in cell wall biosynthesis
MTRDELDFDIMIATRNRQSVLPLALQTMLSQSRLPRHLIVVDSSDNHSEVRQIVESAVRPVDTRVDSQVIRSERGLTYQRNVGLKRVQSPVVFFPDDDALWFPGVAEAVMSVYEKDKEGNVGCVAQEDSPVPPPGVIKETAAPYKVSLRDRFSRLITPITHPLEARLFPDPMFPADKWMDVWGAKQHPIWLPPAEGRLCGPVSGFRMTYRTDVLGKLGGFDENLVRYGLYEDCDASIGSFNLKLNVVARRARVFHYRNPEARANGAEWGMMAILNRTYVVCKHSPPGSTARRKLKPYLYYQIFRYLLQAQNEYGRKRLAGAFYGLSNIQELLNAPKEELANRLSEIRHHFFESKS